MPQHLSQKLRTAFFYIRGKSVSSTVYFTVPVFSVSIFHGACEGSKTKKGAVAIVGPPQGSMNGQVDHSWSRAFCYKLLVLYKVLRLLFK